MYEESAVIYGNKFEVSFRESDSQESLFTPSHVKYDVELCVNGKEFSTVYQCNPSFSTPTLEDIICCLGSDIDSYRGSCDKQEFLMEFGYNSSVEELRKGEKVYSECERAEKFFSDAMNLGVFFDICEAINDGRYCEIAEDEIEIG